MYPFQKFIVPSEVAMLRNLFYQTSYRSLLMICLLMIILDSFLCYFILYEKKHIPSPVYFATDAEGGLIKLIPLAKPNMESTALLQWATDAAMSAYTFNFVNYRNSLQEARSYFTRTGYQTFMNALKVSNNLEAIKKRKFIVNAQLEPGSVPTLLRDSNTDNTLRINGAFTWQVQIPMLLTYESTGENTVVQRIVLTLLIRRISALEAREGVGIDSFIVREVI